MSYKIGAVILAAGQSSRMGRNKLLELLAGKPMIRYAVDAALASRAEPVIVVTGNESAKIRSSLACLPLTFQENSDFPKGLSSSLKCGLNALPDDCDGALILLGDMPGLDSSLLDRLIAAFDPGADLAIVIATRKGQRRNPVLWSRRFFPQIQALSGDQGARSLFGQYPDLIVEVEAANDLTDIDTPEALEAYRDRQRQAGER